MTELRAAEQLTFGGFLALSKLDSHENVTVGGLAAALWTKPRAFLAMTGFIFLPCSEDHREAVNKMACIGASMGPAPNFSVRASATALVISSRRPGACCSIRVRRIPP